jgi:hypothetical protein
MQDIMTKHEQSGKESVEAISTRAACSGLVRRRNTLFVKNGRYVWQQSSLMMLCPQTHDRYVV